MDVRRLLTLHGDLALGTVVGVLYGLDAARWGDAGFLPGLLLGALAGVGLASRRRAPVPAFVLSAASLLAARFVAPGVEDDSFVVVVVVFVSLYSLGRHAAGAQGWVGAGALAVYVVAFVLDDSGADAGAGSVAYALFFLATPWALGLVIRLRREREAVLSAQNHALRSETVRRTEEAVALERARIARDLHDVVSHAIAVTVLQARGGRKMLGVDDAQVAGCLDAIEHTNTQALGDMRRLLSVLRESSVVEPADPQPSLTHVHDLVERVRSSGLTADLRVHGDASSAPPGVDLSAYRVVQEALTNVLKHAGPDAHAEVEVHYADDHLDVAVTDDGVGATPAGPARTGLGLVGVHERVSVVGGAVEAGPRPGGGFAVRATLPYAVEP